MTYKKVFFVTPAVAVMQFSSFLPYRIYHLEALRYWCQHPRLKAGNVPDGIHHHLRKERPYPQEYPYLEEKKEKKGNK